MTDQAADIAFFAVMASVFPLLQTITARFVLTKDTPMVFGWNSTNPRTPLYSFLFLIQPLSTTCSVDKDHNSTACISAMAACITSRPGSCVVTTTLSAHSFHAKGGKTNGERKCQGS